MAATNLITGRDGSLGVGGGPTSVTIRGWEYSEDSAVASAATSGSSGWKQSAPGAKSWNFKCTIPIAAGSMGTGTGAHAGEANIAVGTSIAVTAKTTGTGTGTVLTGTVIVRRVGNLTVHNDGTDFLGVEVEGTGDGSPTWT